MRSEACTPDQPESRAAKGCEGEGICRPGMLLRVCSHGTQVEPDGISLCLAGGAYGTGQRAENGGIFMNFCNY